MAVLGRATLVSAPQSVGQAAWGVPSSDSYGQTLVAPNDLYLDSFTFYLGPQYSGSGAIEYQAYVYLWNGTAATGSALYTSAVNSYTPGTGYTPVTFFPEIPVTPGFEYVLFFSTGGLQAGRPASTIYWGGDTADAYPQGSFVFQNATNANFLTGWVVASGEDLAFSADFENFQEPEPSTLGLLGIGLAGLGLFAKNKLLAGRVRGS